MPAPAPTENPAPAAPPKGGKIAAIFAQEGVLEVVAGNRPFLLDGTANVWFVGSGNIEIFAVQVADGVPVGARSHFATIKSGQLFCGMDLGRHGHGHGFLAVGLVGTQIHHLPISRLKDLAGQTAFATELAELLDAWVLNVSVGMTKDITPRPQSDLQLQEGAEVSLGAGKKAHAKKGVVWFEGVEGQCLFIGMEELTFGADRFFFPLAPETWIETFSESRLHTFSTATALPEAALWRGLEVLYETLCVCEFINKRLIAVDEYNRLHSKAEYRLAAKEAALAEIASVLQTDLVRDAALGPEGVTDPLFAACKLVGEAAGIVIRPHPELDKANKRLDPLNAIAKASRIRLRAVALRDDWYLHDQGPILAYAKPTKRPVAVLPTGPKSYQLVDPANAVRRPLNAQVAETLEPFAFSFYRPFPDGKLNALTLIKFGSRGLQREFRSVALMGVLIGVLGMLTPYFTGLIFDSVIPGAERHQLLQYFLGLIFAAFGVAAFTITRNIAVLRIEGKMDYSVQAALWDRLLNLPSAFFRRFSAGDLADRAAGVDAIRNTLSGVGVAAILGGLTSVFYLFMLFRYNLGLALSGLGLVALAMVVTIVTNLLQLRYQRQQHTVRGRIAGLVLQLITGVGKIRVAGAEDHAFKVWANAFSEQKRLTFAIGRIGNILAVFNAGFPLISSLVIFASLVGLQSAAAAQAAAGAVAPAMSTGEFIAFSSAFGMFLAAMLALSQASLSIFGVLPIFERLKPIIETAPEVDEDKSYPGELMGEIELYHVNFRYVADGPFILKNISIRIKPGEFVAFVGASGSGKSTMMRLLLGFEKPEAGNVYYDGQDLATLDLREVRQQIGVVLQTSRLMPTDIFRNIVGALPLTIDDAWEAARAAGLEEDIQQMAMGMHTVVSEGGGTFSGGQRQRLMIARAIVNRPRILFFDEATSALDNRTQKIVSDSLNSLHATRIVIAHRLSTIIAADRIFVLEGGRIVQEGSYEELLAQEGLFAELAKRQIA